LKLKSANKLSRYLSSLSAQQKRLALVSTLLLLLVLALIPFGVEQLQLKNTPIKHIISLEYVEYEGEPFNSIILARRYSEDAALLSEFETALHQSRVRPYDKQNNVREILIIRTEDKTIYAYIQNNLLGLNYGQVKLHFSQLTHFLQRLPATELTTKQK